MLNVAIVEDDDRAAEDLEACLETYREKNGTAYSAARFRDGSAFLIGYAPRYDIIFMDIKMPGLDGMSAASQLREMDSVTTLIFVTSMVQYAVKGYEVGALDFIVKPVRYPSFETKMRRAIQSVQMRKGREVQLTVGGGVRVMPSSAIYYIEVMDHDLTYHTEEGDLLVRGKLGGVEQQLPADSFFRCSASHLINLRYVTQFSGDTVRVAGNDVRVSRARKKELMAAMAAYLGRGV